MLEQFLIRSIANGLFIAGFWRVTRMVPRENAQNKPISDFSEVDTFNSYIGWPIRFEIYRLVKSPMLRKPLIDCTMCMGSVYSILPYWISPPNQSPWWQAAGFIIYAISTGFIANRLTYDLEP